MLLRGRAWAIYDLFAEDSTDIYAYLKSALLQFLCPDSKEDRLAGREQLSKGNLQKGREKIDEVAHDLEILLDKASPGLPAEIRDTELCHHLINSLPGRIAL